MLHIIQKKTTKIKKKIKIIKIWNYEKKVKKTQHSN